jgi:hypothetical protein
VSDEAWAEIGVAGSPISTPVNGVSLDVLVLGLASVIRPTSVAAVYAFLAAHSPRPLLVAYLTAGLALSLTVGVVAVTVVHVNPPPPTVSSTARDIVDIAFGVACLAAALYYGLRSPRDRPATRPDREPSAMRRRLSRPTVRSASVAGVVTHLPGVFYLAALAAIVASRPGLTGGLLQVGLYNLLWYAVPLAALVSWVRYPETTRENAARLTAAVQAHKKTLVVVVFVLVGLYLLITGIHEITVA